MGLVTVQEAAFLLKRGEVVAIPTETVYGLAARYDCLKAIHALYQLKGRPKEKALTVNLHEGALIKTFVESLPPGCEELMNAYWPGPLTLVIDIQEEAMLPEICGGGLRCGFRVPAHSLALEVIREVGPIVLPSANLSGALPATDAQGVQEIFEERVSILDGGPCVMGIASTVLGYEQGRWIVLREGAIAPAALKNILGYLPSTL